MWRTCSLALLLLGGCDNYARSYSKAVQNQMIDADDRQGAQIAQLQQQVNELHSELSSERELRARDDALLYNVVKSTGNEVDANANYVNAVLDENHLQH